jgi:hypothetical protein
LLELSGSQQEILVVKASFESAACALVDRYTTSMKDLDLGLVKQGIFTPRKVWLQPKTADFSTREGIWFQKIRP